MKLKKITTLIVLLTLSYSSNSIHAQSMGISNSTITPDPSSILEMRATDKGMLIPRMTTAERDGISTPATGLMMYNTTSNQFNFFNGTYWAVSVSANTPFLAADAGSTLTTSSTSDTAIADMSKTVLEQGSYVVFFNSQVSIPAAEYTTGFSTSLAAADLNLIYTDIMVPVV